MRGFYDNIPPEAIQMVEDLDAVVRSAQATHSTLVMKSMIELFDDYLKDKPARKALSHYGAVRLTRARALEHFKRKDPINDKYVMIVKKDGQEQPSFAVYKDVGNFAYKYFLDRMVKNNHLGKNVSGDIVECILAMLWFHQLGTMK